MSFLFSHRLQEQFLCMKSMNTESKLVDSKPTSNPLGCESDWLGGCSAHELCSTVDNRSNEGIDGRYNAIQ